MEADEQMAFKEALERAFDRKRSNFLADYELDSRPALVWQAGPVSELLLDISDEKLKEAISGGGGSASNDGWWHGFKMGWRPSLVFDGLASATDHGAAGWATEIHVDGHLIAGVWTFPEFGPGVANSGPGAADFYVNAFRDFAYLAGRVSEAAGNSAAVHLTCTMHNADQLPLLGSYDRVQAPAPKRKTLRWPIATTKVTALVEAGTAMAAQFMRAYGKASP